MSHNVVIVHLHMFDIGEIHTLKFVNQVIETILLPQVRLCEITSHNQLCIVTDEMQNSTPNQMKMLLTRLGDNTKLIVTGDLAQSDLGEENGLNHLIHKLQGMDLTYIEHVEMDDDDIVRHPAVNEVLKVLNV